MSANNRVNLSAKDEALLILEYLENEQMSKTFLNFLDENKHLVYLRSRLYFNYENPDQWPTENDIEVLDFQRFFNLSKQNGSSESCLYYFSSSFLCFLECLDQTFLTNNHSDDLFFDDDFLNVGLSDLISQTPPTDYQHDHLPDTPVPSVPPVNSHEQEDFNSTLEQLFAMSHEPLATPPSQPIVQIFSDSHPKPSFTKCIVVTQDFLQSMYSQQPTTIPSNNLNSIPRLKRRRRRLKAGKENCSQQRKIMPRTSIDH